MKTYFPESAGKGVYLPPKTELIQTLSLAGPLCASIFSNTTEVWDEYDLSSL